MSITKSTQTATLKLCSGAQGCVEIISNGTDSHMIIDTKNPATKAHTPISGLYSRTGIDVIKINNKQLFQLLNCIVG